MVFIFSKYIITQKVTVTAVKGLKPRENYHHTWYRGARLKKAVSSG